MTLFDTLKWLHVSCAVLSVTGFVLRGIWLFTGNPRLQARLAKVAPHAIDTVLLASAVGMLVIWGVSPLQASWLMAKIIALLFYIGFGMVALRFGKTAKTRITAWILALLCVAYIVAVALTKSPVLSS